MKPLVVEGFTPHRDQLDKIRIIENDGYKYHVLTTGRQYGKSILGQNLLLKWALENPKAVVMWVSPIYAQARKVFADIYDAIAGTPILKSHNKSNLQLKLINGSVIEFRSAERPDSLRGYTLDYLLVDEAAYIRDNVWFEVLRPMVLVRGKKCLFISTPKGKNWFYQMAIKGMDDDNKEHIYLKATSYDTPYITKDELDEAKRTLPEDIYRQEILGEFIDTGGEVFVQLDRYCILNSWTFPDKSKKYYAGLDLGRQNDYSVLTIMDNDGRVVYIYRDRQKDWGTIINNVVYKLKEYNCHCFVEVNSIGDVLLEQIQKQYKNVDAFLTTQSSKQNIIEDLIYACNENLVELPSESFFNPLYNELKTYTYQYSVKTRKISYGGMEGSHDDTVMSLAMCYHSLKSKKTKGQYFIYHN